MTTDGNAQWSQWARQYPHEGQGIPVLYVIRADGEKLYARSGALSGAALPQMLLATLNQSGRIFSDAEAERLKAAVEQAKAAMQGEDPIAAARALGQLKPLGTPGELKSYSAPAQEADKLAEELASSASARIEEAKAGLQDPERAFESVLLLVEARDAYEVFPALHAEINQVLRSAERDEALSPLISQATSLERARRYAAAGTAGARKTAVTAYERIVQRYAGTKVEALARRELAELDPDAEILAAGGGDAGPAEKEPRAEPFRTWTDRTGKFGTKARLVGVKEGRVALEKPDGKTIVLPLDRLSETDQAYVRTRNQ